METQIATQTLEPPRSAAPRLLFFHSGHCGRCRRTEAYLAQVLQRRHNHDTFALHRVDVDERPELACRFAIEHVPTIVVVQDRRVRARLVAPTGCDQIRVLLAPWLR